MLLDRRIVMNREVVRPRDALDLICPFPLLDGGENGSAATIPLTSFGRHRGHPARGAPGMEQQNTGLALNQQFLDVVRGNFFQVRAQRV